MHILRKYFFLLVIPFLASCNTVPYSPVESSAIVEVTGKEQVELYDGVRQWFSETFVSAESVIDYESRETSTVIGKAKLFLGNSMTIKQYARVQLKVETKEGRMRITSIVLEHLNSDTSNGEYTVTYGVTEKRNQLAQEQINMLIKSLEDYVNAKGSSEW